MSKIENNGGPAFPNASLDINEGLSALDGGMSLRDYFAGQALAGLTSDHTLDMSAKAFAESSYRFADAMLA